MSRKTNGRRGTANLAQSDGRCDCDSESAKLGIGACRSVSGIVLALARRAICV